MQIVQFIYDLEKSTTAARVESLQANGVGELQRVVELSDGEWRLSALVDRHDDDSRGVNARRTDDNGRRRRLIHVQQRQEQNTVSGNGSSSSSNSSSLNVRKPNDERHTAVRVSEATRRQREGHVRLERLAHCPLLSLALSSQQQVT